MFMGQFNHTIDPKNRLFLPARFREELGDSFVITAGLDGCLYICPRADFEEFAKKLSELPFTAQTRQFQRFFMQNAAECDQDKQGRFIIPTILKELAGIKKDIVFVGVISKIEVWSKERFEQSAPSDSVEDIAERMSTEFGLRF